MHLLIVDDEPHVVDRLRKTIPWQNIGITQVFHAYSAQEALTLMQQCSVEILITDIRMPGMSGLEFIAEIRRRWSRTKCVLLSGYSDFEYAKEAIRHQVEEYLLKPVTEEELLQTVSRLMERIKEEWEHVYSVQKLTQTLTEHLPLLRRNILHELLQRPLWNESELREKMHTLSLPDLIGKPCSLLLIRMEEPFIHYDYRSLALIEYAVCNITEELFQEQFHLWHTKDAHDYLIFAAAGKGELSGDQAAKQMEMTAIKLQSAAESLLKGHISVIVSDMGVFPEALPSMYDRCLEAARKRIANDQSIFLQISGKPLEMKVQSLRSLHEPPAFIHLLEAGRWAEVEKKLRRVWVELETQDNPSQEHLLEVYFAVSSAFTYIAHKNGRPLSALVGEEYNKLTASVPFRSIPQLKTWAEQMLHRLKEEMDREHQDSRSALIREIHKFIDDNLSDVSLQTIADHVSMHPVYISKIYKLETGENISDYIHKLRMEKAAYLLANSHEKTYEIAEKLGYLRSHSFIHTFKKHYGLTPQEFREQRI